MDNQVETVFSGLSRNPAALKQEQAAVDDRIYYPVTALEIMELIKKEDEYLPVLAKEVLSQKETADGKAADEEAADKKAADKKAADEEAADGKAANGKAVDRKAADEETVDGKAADGKAADEPAAEIPEEEQKNRERKEAGQSLVNVLRARTVSLGQAADVPGEMKVYTCSLVSFYDDREAAAKRLKKDLNINEEEAKVIFETLAKGKTYLAGENSDESELERYRRKYEDIGFQTETSAYYLPFTKALAALYKYNLVPVSIAGRIDMQLIEKMDKMLDADEKIAYVELVDVYRTDKVKKNRKGGIKIPFLDGTQTLYVLYTNKRILYPDHRFKKDSGPYIYKADIQAVCDVYEKKLLSTGQVQFELADGTVLLHQPCFYSQHEKKFSEYVQKIHDLLQQME